MSEHPSLLRATISSFPASRCPEIWTHHELGSMMEIMKKFLLCLAVLLLLFGGGAMLWKEVRVLDSWSHGNHTMSMLATITREYLAKKWDSLPNSVEELRADDEYGALLQGMVILNHASNEKCPILYWLPLDRQGDVIFITASPMRSIFSTQYYRLYVNKAGEMKKMVDRDFVALVERSSLSKKR